MPKGQRLSLLTGGSSMGRAVDNSALDKLFREADNGKVDEEFFAAGKPCFGCEQEFFPEGHVKSNFLCNLWVR